MKTQTSIRASALTKDQIEKLKKWWGTNTTETLALAVDRAYREEATKRQSEIAS